MNFRFKKRSEIGGRFWAHKIFFGHPTPTPEGRVFCPQSYELIGMECWRTTVLQTRRNGAKERGERWYGQPRLPADFRGHSGGPMSRPQVHIEGPVRRGRRAWAPGVSAPPPLQHSLRAFSTHVDCQDHWGEGKGVHPEVQGKAGCRKSAQLRPLLSRAMGDWPGQQAPCTTPRASGCA